MKDIRGVIRLVPAFGEIGLDPEGARRYVTADLVPQELTVHEAQHGMRPGVAGKMGIEVHRIPPTHAQAAPTPGRPHGCAPKRGRVMERPGRQGDAGGEARLQQLATAHTLGLAVLRMYGLHKRVPESALELAHVHISFPAPITYGPTARPMLILPQAIASVIVIFAPRFAKCVFAHANLLLVDATAAPPDPSCAVVP